MKRHLSRNGNCCDAQATGVAFWRQQHLFAPAEVQCVPSHLPWKALQRAVQDIVFSESTPHLGRRVKLKRMRFPKRQLAEALIEIAIAQQDPRDRGVTIGSRVEGSKAFDLRSNLR